jgi:NADPH2:quinone reductase
MSTAMRAVVMDEPGGPEVLHPAEMSKPGLQTEHDVLVRLKAAGVNPIDTKIRATAAAYPVRLPAILGCDGAGVVEAVGSAVSEFKPGDEVYYCQIGFGARFGNYAEYAAVDQKLVAKKPSSLSFEQAAAAPLVLITAWEALHDRARIRPGHDVLIHAGAGGVGHVAIQLAKLAGARVATTVGSDEKAAFAESMGADNTIFYREENFTLALLDWTDEQGVDIVFDTVGGEVFEHSFTAAKVYGDIVTLLQPGPDVNWTVARQRNLRISFELMLTPAYLGMAEAMRAQGDILKRCAELFDAGKLRIHVDRVLPLAEAAEAHRLLHSGAAKGKLALSVD